MIFIFGKDVTNSVRRKGSDNKIPTCIIMKRMIISLLVVYLFAFPAFSYADELIFLKGKDTPVCKAHHSNLKNLRLDRMVCERDNYYLEKNGITRPEWEDLDLKVKINKELFIKMSKFFTYGDQNVKNEDLDDDKKYEKFKKYASCNLDYTNANIANDGIEEKLVRFSAGRCMSSSYYARSLAVVDGSNKVDTEKTKQLLQNISKPGYVLKNEAQESLFRVYDIFFYRDKTYFDKWFAYDWTLTVYKLHKGKTEIVCKFKYKKDEM